MPAGAYSKHSMNGRAWGMTHKGVKMGIGKLTGLKVKSSAPSVTQSDSVQATG